MEAVLYGQRIDRLAKKPSAVGLCFEVVGTQACMLLSCWILLFFFGGFLVLSRGEVLLDYTSAMKMLSPSLLPIAIAIECAIGKISKDDGSSLDLTSTAFVFKRICQSIWAQNHAPLSRIQPTSSSPH
jgi:hypothetical protein